MNNRTPTQAMTNTLDDLAQIYGDVYADWLRAVTRFYEFFERRGRDLGDAAAALRGSAPPAARGRCAIPAACWMPRELGERASQICPGQTATISLRIINCGASRRTFAVKTGSASTGVSITNSPLELAPMEEGTIVVSCTADASDEHGTARRLLLWVRGCREHVLRWNVTVGRGATATCHDVDVEDCPDTVHHWYDHFYCDHPCTARHG